MYTAAGARKGEGLGVEEKGGKGNGPLEQPWWIPRRRPSLVRCLQAVHVVLGRAYICLLHGGNEEEERKERSGFRVRVKGGYSGKLGILGSGLERDWRFG